MIIAGIGCRRGTTAAVIEASIAEALSRANLNWDHVSLIATSDRKAKEAGIIRAAAKLRRRLVFVSAADLRQAAERTVTRSARVQAITGVPSIAEAAALAAGGPASQLVAPRVVFGPVTCALAASGTGP